MSTMKRPAWLAIGAALLVTAGMLLGLRYLVIDIIPGLPANEHLEYYKLSVEIFKVILVGFGATLIGILFPLIFAETRARFERLKDSRTAYSEAKTAGDYLAVRLCTLDLKGAAATLQ